MVQNVRIGDRQLVVEALPVSPLALVDHQQQEPFGLHEDGIRRTDVVLAKIGEQELQMLVSHLGVSLFQDALLV